MKPINAPSLSIAVLAVAATGCYASVSTEPVYAEAYHEPPRVYAMRVD
jgi:hypothetical protein